MCACPFGDRGHRRSSFRSTSLKPHQVDTPLCIQFVFSDIALIWNAILSRESEHFYGTGESFLFTCQPRWNFYSWAGDNQVPATQSGLWIYPIKTCYGWNYCPETYLVPLILLLECGSIWRPKLEYFMKTRSIIPSLVSTTLQLSTISTISWSSSSSSSSSDVCARLLLWVDGGSWGRSVWHLAGQQS